MRSQPRRVVLAALLVLVTASLVVFAPIPTSEPAWREEVSLAEYQALAGLSGRLSRRQLEQTLAYIDPAGLLAPYLEVSDEAAVVRLEPDSEPVAVVKLAVEDQPAPSRPGSLAEMRVLVDPGHFGGDWSEVEGRHYQTGDWPPLREGTLTWGVSRLLIEKLVASGTEVLSSRGPPPTTAFPAHLDQGFDADDEARYVLAERLADPAIAEWVDWPPSLVARYALARCRRAITEQSGLFYLYSRYDLRRRAALAARLNADVTVSLHFNMSSWRDNNWLILFIPGNVMPGELESQSQRYWAIRRALDGQHPVMVELGRAIMREMRLALQVPIIEYVEEPDAVWPKKLAVDPELGVYARNLAVLRRTRGPVVLVEGPPLDNPHEYEKLHERGLLVDGVDFPPRIGRYADAVAEGLQAWAASGRGRPDIDLGHGGHRPNMAD